MVEATPLVSIGLPFFNSEKTLKRTIRSILLQTYPNWELILIDDGSTDNSLAIAQSFEDPRIKIYSNSMNIGLVGSLNKAIALSKGKYFARMDADDICYPGRLERQLQYLAGHPNVDLLGCWVLVFGANGKPLGKRARPESHAEICATPFDTFQIDHPAYIAKLDWFKKYGYKDWAVRCEDHELLLRTYKDSCFANVPEILLGYDESSLSLKNLLKSRSTKVRVHFKAFRAQGESFARFLGVLFKQTVKGIYDSIALLSGLDHKLLSHRIPEALSDSEKEQWDDVWHACSLP